MLCVCARHGYSRGQQNHFLRWTFELSATPVFRTAGTVLRLDANGTWYVLASDVRADRVEQLHAQLKEYGYSLPVENIERTTASSLPTSAP